MNTSYGSTADLVVIDLTFSDETYGTTEPMTRWEAEWLLRVIGEYGVPYRGKRVICALLIPREPIVH